MSRQSLALLAGCWLAAVSFIALAGTNDRAILRAAGDFERLCREAPQNQAGRGACAALARDAPPLMFDPDAYCWIELTQGQARAGLWRSHAYPFDNAPYGRQKHWSSSLNWWLWLLGGLVHVTTGQPMDAAIAAASLWANPLLFALFLLGIGAAFGRALGAGATGILLITLAAFWGVQWDFSYGRPDHHGLHLAAFVGMTLCALAGGLGWTGVSRRWFTASALFGAMGLWIGAAQQCVGIGALGAGAAVSALAFGGSEFAAERWRHWARVGAAASLGFYLLEYFPGGMGMRLEVNHPLYALAWWGGGECIWLLARWRNLPGRPWRAALAAAAIGALPAAIFFGPARWCVFRDPWLAHLFSVMSEGKPWMEHWTLGPVATQVWEYTGALLLALPVAAFLARRRPVVLALLPMAVLFLALTLRQNRWMGFLECSLAILAIAMAPDLPRLRGGALPLGLLALTVPGWSANCALQFRTMAENPLNHARATLTEQLALQELSWNLRLLATSGRPPLRVMAPSGPSPLLHYYGGVQTVGSFYWENLAGSRATLDFYNDSGEAVARRIARERGLDCVLAIARPEFVMELQTIQLGQADVAQARKSLAYRLANTLGGAVPAWLEPVPLLDAPLALNRGMRLYRVLPDRLGD